MESAKRCEYCGKFMKEESISSGKPEGGNVLDGIKNYICENYIDCPQYNNKLEVN